MGSRPRKSVVGAFLSLTYKLLSELSNSLKRESEQGLGRAYISCRPVYILLDRSSIPLYALIHEQVGPRKPRESS